MDHGVAQHVLERRQHALEHLPVELPGRALDLELHFPARFLRRLPDQPPEPLHVALERHHPRTHQAVLQLGDHAALLLQQVLPFPVQVAEQSLDARDVAGRLRERPRELLDRRIAIELQRVEVLAALAVLLVTEQYLRLGLHLELAQLLAQARHRAPEFRQVELDRGQLLLDAGAEDARLARVVEQVVEQLRIDPGELVTLDRGGRLASRQYRVELRLLRRLDGRDLLRRFRDRRLGLLGDELDQRRFLAGLRDELRRRRQDDLLDRFDFLDLGLGGRLDGHLLLDRLERLRRDLDRGGLLRFGCCRQRRLRCSGLFGAGHRSLDAARLARHREPTDPGDQRRGGLQPLAAARLLPHPVQLVERGLQHLEALGHRLDLAGLERGEERLDFVAQVAHRANARHPGTALDRVQQPLEFGQLARVRPILPPVRQRGFRLLEQLAGLLAEDGRDVRVELLLDGLRHRRRFLEPRQLRVEGPLQRLPAGRERIVIREKAGVLGHVLRHGLQAPERVAEQRETLRRQAVAVLEELADVPLHRLRDLDALPDLRGLGGAAQRVAGAVQRLADREWRRAGFAAGEELADHRDVRLGFLAEDLQQHRIHPVLGGHGLGGRGLRHLGRLGRRGLRDRGQRRQRRLAALAAGQRVGARHQARQVQLRLGTVFEFVDQRRNRLDRLAGDRDDLGRTRQRLADHPVEQALDAPAELADSLRPDHAAAALQRVEDPPQVAQRIRILRILLPAGEEFLEVRGILAGFLDEQFEKLGIASRRDRRGRRGRLDAGHGRLRLGGRLLPVTRGVQRHDPALGSREAGEACLGCVEQLQGLGLAGLQQLHVVLDRDDGLGQLVEARGLERIDVRPDDRREHAPDLLHHFHGALAAQHQQPRRDAAHQLRDLVESLRFLRRLERLCDGFLDPGHVDGALAQHGRLHQQEFLAGRLALLRRGRCGVADDQPQQLAVESVLDLDQRGGDPEQRAIIRCRTMLDDRLQRLDLALHAVPQLAETEHAERVADLVQHLELRRELLHLGAALAHEDIQHVLDAREVLADRGGDGLHQPDARRGQRVLVFAGTRVRRQDVRQPERAAHGLDPRPAGGGARDVEQQVVQQLERRPDRVARLAEFLQPAQLPVDLAEQPLDRHVVL